MIALTYTMKLETFGADLLLEIGDLEAGDAMTAGDELAAERGKGMDVAGDRWCDDPEVGHAMGTGATGTRLPADDPAPGGLCLVIERPQRAVQARAG
jgi:hypothetical protein